MVSKDNGARGAAGEDWRDLLYLYTFLDIGLSNRALERHERVWIRRFLANRGKPQLYRRMDEIIAGRISMNLTVDQDVHYLRDMQAGMHSRGFKQAWLSEDESRVQHFHDWVDTWMNSTTPILRKAGPYRQTP